MKTISVLFISTCITVTGCNGSTPKHSHDGHGGEAEEKHETVRKGPNGGRLLEDGTASIEVRIFEAGIPPEFRVWAYENDKPLDPSGVELKAVLGRFGGKKQDIGFEVVNGYLRGTSTVYEPHSFKADWGLKSGGKTYRFSYEQLEGRTSIPSAIAEQAGIRTHRSGPAELRERLTLRGQIVPNRERTAHIHPRYAGIVRKVLKSTGDRVAAGEILAVVESNESLSNYDIRSGIAGTVLDIHAVTGEFVSPDDRMFTVSDLKDVWLELSVPRQDLPLVRAGQSVQVRAPNTEIAAAKISFVAPVVDEDTQSSVARAVIPNPRSVWRPGLYVDALVVTDTRKVGLAVRSSSLQTFRDWVVVFQKSGDEYEIVPVETGATDGEWTEITDGLEAETEYVSEGSFVIKADILKSQASHDH